jgi:hypothetical protein
MEDEVPRETVNHCIDHLILQPKALKRVLWDVLGAMTILYDLVVVPMQFFNLQPSLFTTVMSWNTRLYWTFDIPVTMLSGYMNREGDYEMLFTRIFWHYLKTWLFFDTFLVCSDWGSALTGSTARGLGLLRILRMTRLIRLARIPALLATVFEQINSESISIFANIAGALFAVMGLVHVIACIWFGMGNHAAGWVGINNYREDSFGQKYAVSLHWSISQIAGSMELAPATMSERFFAVAMLLFGFVVASVFVSSITSSITRLHIMSNGPAAHIQVLRRFLHQREVNRRLMTRVLRNAKHALHLQQQSISEGEVQLLTMISEPLLSELHFDIFGKALEEHPLFQRYIKENDLAMRKICHSGVSPVTFQRGDLLFSIGEEPSSPQMLFLQSGELEYLHRMHTTVATDIMSMLAADADGDGIITREEFLDAGGSATEFDKLDEDGSGSIERNEIYRMAATMATTSFANPNVETLGRGQWCCENVLWIQWLHQGYLRASIDVQMVTLDADVFQDMSQKCLDPGFPVHVYAQTHVHKLMHDGPAALSDITPLGEVVDIVNKAFGSAKRSNPTRYVGSSPSQNSNKVSIASDPSRMSDDSAMTNLMQASSEPSS